MNRATEIIVKRVSEIVMEKDRDSNFIYKLKSIDGRIDLDEEGKLLLKDVSSINLDLNPEKIEFKDDMIIYYLPKSENNVFFYELYSSYAPINIDLDKSNFNVQLIYPFNLSENNIGLITKNKGLNKNSEKKDIILNLTDSFDIFNRRFKIENLGIESDRMLFLSLLTQAFNRYKEGLK